MCDIKVIFGGAGISPQRGFEDAAAVSQAMKILAAHGIDTIDTARFYDQSELILGNARAATSFLIDTKISRAVGSSAGSLRHHEIWESLQTSLKILKTDQVNTLYIDWPSPSNSIPMKEVLATINEMHKAGHFLKFGLDNCLLEDIEIIWRHCEAHGYILPTVYQGTYNPISRYEEDDLLPTLRRLGISFYAYSPITGGFLAQSEEEVRNGEARFRTGSFWWNLYASSHHLEALEIWRDFAVDLNCEPAGLAYRWLAFHSSLEAKHGDGIILGSCGISQLEQNLSWLNEGPLSQDIVSKFDALWHEIEKQTEYWF